MTLSNHDDLSLRYLLTVPSDKPNDAEMPLVLVMHGRGADASDLAELAPAMDSGYRFVFPNAPRPFEPSPGMSFGFTWFNGWPPDPASFVETRVLVLRFIDEVATRYPTPEGKIMICGFSQGGMVTLDVGFRTQKQLAGLVVMSGALNDEDLPPFHDKPSLPVLMIHGTADDMIPVLAARRSRRILEHNKIEPDYHEFDMGHYVTPQSVAVVRDFMRRWFDPAPIVIPEIPGAESAQEP